MTLTILDLSFDLDHLGPFAKLTVGTDPHTKTHSFNSLLLDYLESKPLSSLLSTGILVLNLSRSEASFGAPIAVLRELKIQSLSPHKFHSLSLFGLFICIEMLGEYKCCWHSIFFLATVRGCLSSVLRHCSHLCEEKLIRERCVNHVTSYAYLIKEPLDALSPAMFALEKIAIRSFLCGQNHFFLLIRHQTNNYCYFLID